MGVADMQSRSRHPPGQPTHPIMRKLLVFQHVPAEPLGTLDPMFRDAGFRIRYVNFHRSGDTRVAIDRYHGLVVLGGPMAADETDRYPHLEFEKEAILRAIESGIPVLGICLGAQLMAAALGGTTLRGAAPEFGWRRVEPTDEGRSDSLFAHLDTSEPIFQWHSDTFTLPPGAAHLARSTDCEHQAFRIGERAYGLQFHLEADAALIRRWVGASSEVPGIADGRIPFDPAEALLATRRLMARSTRLAEAVFGEFIGRFFRFHRRWALPSR
jgi:GMP synthase (glutamine-hydrolysing)